MERLESFRWPRVSLRMLFAAATIFGAAGGIVVMYGEDDDVLGTMLGGIVLIWCLLCWWIVRLNPDYFQLRRSAKRQKVDTSEPSQIPIDSNKQRDG